MAWPAIKQAFVQERFRVYVGGQVWNRWRPSKIVWHNTAAPSLAQWIKSADADRRDGRIPGITRIGNLEKYFRDNNHWSGCPHLFVANDLIWVMNPLTAPGVHSPSFNNTAIGIEMIGDFSKEDPNSGDGFKVKQNTIFVTAVLCSTLGLNPRDAILLHKEDRKTTHDCPGKLIADQKPQMVSAVVELMEGGEHQIEETTPRQIERGGMVMVPDLTVRRGPGVINEAIGSLHQGTPIVILDEAKNGTTAWLKVRTPTNYVGWVAGRFIKGDNA